jgi:hypothetical protein
MKLLFVGDIVLDRALSVSPEVRAFAQEHDYQIANFEAPLSGGAPGIAKAGVHIQSSPAHLPSLRAVFNCVTLANNHTMDFGLRGLTETRMGLERHGILHTGTGATIDEAFTPLDLGSVVVFAVCENEFGGVTYEHPGVAVFDHLRVLYSKIQAAKATKSVIVTYHGGSEIIPIPQSYLRERFQMLREFGADLVIGHHPHVVQGCENNIFYSLGNFFCEGGKFSQYENADWGLCVSYDTDSKTASLRHVGSVGGTLQFVSKDANLVVLNKLLQSPDYNKLSDHISRELCHRWYLSRPMNHVPILLHYFRCDAHRHNFSIGLSSMNGETDGQSKQHGVDITHTDSFHIRLTK